MNEKKMSLASVKYNIIYMVLFGVLSYVLGLIKFQIPGLDGAITDLREIPLLIGLFYLNNPLYIVAMSAISSLSTSPDGSYLSTLIMHCGSLIISWYIYKYLINKTFTNVMLGISWFFFSILYYLFLLIPLFIISNKIVGLNSERSFISFYLELLKSLSFEMVASSLISSLYLVQLEIRITLQNHKSNLEVLVKKRTEELDIAYDELKIKNDELVMQKEELSSTLENLKHTQSRLIQSEKMASLGTLTAGIAHEINNPLNFINGGIQIISDLEPDLKKATSEEVKEQYDKAIFMIRSGLEKTTEIVQSLMTFSFRGTPKLVLSDLNKIIDNTLLFLNSKIKNEILIIKEYKLQREVPVYPNKLHQVIMNFLDNAIYAVMENDTDKTREIAILTDQINNHAIIKISNNGPKIDKENLSQIFDPFFTTKEPGKGIGLGLSICYTLIREHGGSIHVENIQNGVSFTIEIPLNAT